MGELWNVSAVTSISITIDKSAIIRNEWAMTGINSQSWPVRWGKNNLTFYTNFQT